MLIGCVYKNLVRGIPYSKTSVTDGTVHGTLHSLSIRRKIQRTVSVFHELPTIL